MCTSHLESQEGSVGTATRYGLDGLGSIPGSARFFSSPVSRPALRPTWPPIQWVLGALSPRVKWKRREADHSLPSNAEVKNGGATPPYTFTA
jgi:hypothetical protein